MHAREREGRVVEKKGKSFAEKQYLLSNEGSVTEAAVPK
jgi:hypothetical protein